jgi:hypothetical protein
MWPLFMPMALMGGFLMLAGSSAKPTHRQSTTPAQVKD